MGEITISPVTRISGLLSIDVYLDAAGRVYEANCLGEQFRGFEAMMRGRKATDAVYFTQRICGICSMAHGFTAARLVERLYGAVPAPEMILLQQAMLGAEFLQNHIRHFYLLALPDYLDCEPSSGQTIIRASGVRSRFNAAQQQQLIGHYFAAMAAGRQCHDMLAVFGGKIPHQHGLTPEGLAVRPTADRKLKFLSLLAQVTEFIERAMLPDLNLLAGVYADYYRVGIGPLRYISFGLFDPAYGGHFPAGVLAGTELNPVRIDEIEESVTFSWYEKEDFVTIPQPEKPAAYSWVKAARYRGLSYEGGPLARKFIRLGGADPGMAGAMGRLAARAEEARSIASWMRDWVQDLPAEGRYVLPLEAPTVLRAVYTGDAPRGPLLHAMTVQGDQVESYDIVTPSTWNFSPKDALGRPGPAEEALIGTTVDDPANPVDVGRIVRSFDPCLSCATHCIDWRGRSLTRVNVMA